MSTLKLVLGHPTLRLIAVALTAWGANNASIYPYQSLIAVEKIGLSKADYALVLVMASAVAVASSILFGVLGDQTGRRRLIALITAASTLLGLALMILAPGPVTLTLAHGILLPAGTSIYGQLFALMRVQLPMDGKERAVVQANVRSTMSGGFMAMLVFWTLVFPLGVDVMAVYYSAGLATLGLSLVVALRWPRDAGAPAPDVAATGMTGALREMARPLVLSRVVMMGAIASAANLYMVLVSLVFHASPLRGTGDVALYVGLVAGWEVPAMLWLPRLVAHWPRATVLLVGAGFYACHVTLMPWLVDSPTLWVMTLAAGIGGAAIITLPIAYYQDLLHTRPGVASSLLAVQKLVGDVIAAAVFYLGTRFGGYETAAILGGIVSLGAAVALMVADRRAWLMPGLQAAE